MVPVLLSFNLNRLIPSHIFVSTSLQASSSSKTAVSREQKQPEHSIRKKQLPVQHCDWVHHSLSTMRSSLSNHCHGSSWMGQCPYKS